MDTGSDGFTPSSGEMLHAIPGGKYLIEGVSGFGSEKRAIQFHVQ
jgi:hypothetical protein